MKASQKIRIQTNAAPPALGSYSQAIRSGDFVFVTGQTGRNPNTRKLLDGVEAQARQMMANVGAVLNAAGCSPAGIVRANLILADSRLALEQQDLFTANQVIHLKPIVGDELLDDFLAANPFVRRLYPNALAWHPHRLVDLPERGLLQSLKRGLELVLAVPSPLIERACRRLYGWYLRRRAGGWRSPEQVMLDPDVLKLHTRSHRHSVLDRFDHAVGEAWRHANRPTARAAAR